MKEARRESEATNAVIVSSAILIRRKEKGLLMETPTSRLMHMRARRQQRVRAGKQLRFCCQEGFGFSEHELAPNRSWAKRGAEARFI